MTKSAAGLAALAAVLAWWPAAAQDAAKPDEVVLVGCIELEGDYRARKDAGKGGVLGTGVGVGNEFVLTSAKPPAGRKGPLSASGSATDYELTGRLEKDFLRHVGRQVEVVGTIEKGEGIDRINVSLWHPVGDYCPPVK